MALINRSVIQMCKNKAGSVLIFLFTVAVFTNCSDNSVSFEAPAPESEGAMSDTTYTDTTHADTSGESGNSSYVGSDFIVFDGTRFREKPDMAQFGFQAIEVIYALRMWEEKSWDDIGPWQLPSQNLVKYWAHRAGKVNSSYAVLDIEHWPNHGDTAEVQKSISNYSQVLDWFKEAEPELNVGYFDTLPIKKRYMRTPLIPEYYQQWQDNNDQLIPLADKVDVFYPHLYTYNQDQQQWVTNAKYMIKEARRYSEDKPVFVFLWPQFYALDEPQLEGQYIDKEYWQLQLETAHKYADGVIIWFPYKTEWKEASNGPWWETTKNFIEGLKEV